MAKEKYIIGIDPGTKTGFAVWNPIIQSFNEISTLSFGTAFKAVLHLHLNHIIVVYVEDARKRSGKNNPKIFQGVGSIKGESKCWENVLDAFGIIHVMRKPQINTKLSKGNFNAITGWKLNTSNHGRDAAMMVYKMTEGHMNLEPELVKK